MTVAPPHSPPPESPTAARQTPLLRLLDELGIPYALTEHDAAFTVAQADQLYGDLPGGHSKNLFLRNKRGDRHYLVVVESHRSVDLKALRTRLGEATLSFASPERLLRHLGLTPGSVSPFGLIHDGERAVTVIVDQGLLAHTHLNFHPNVNTATLTVEREGFERFLAHCGHAVQWVDFVAAAGP